MIPPLLIGLGIGALFVAAFWDEIVDWLKSFTKKVAEAFRKGGIGHAAKIFAQELKNGVMNIIHRVFFKEDNKWIRETTRAEVDESEVPEWAKAGVAQSEVDVTERYKEKLSLEL